MRADRVGSAMKARADAIELIKEAREGKEHALDALLRTYRNYLGILARAGISGTLGAKADASDLIQETLLHAYRRFSQFSGQTEGEWLAWLRRILARNLAMLARRYHGTASRDVSRERAIEAGLNSTSFTLGHLIPADSQTPSHVAQERERSVVLADALAEMPEDHREVVVLRNFQRLKWEETAMEMGRSPEAVRKLWARAIRRLGTIIEGRQI
jgi:RNA polymerase sigma-70 factor (ECF subfamily)